MLRFVQHNYLITIVNLLISLNTSPLPPWMEVPDHLLQVVAVQMGVDLGRGDGLVAQHFLYRTQVCTSFDQVGGKRVPKGMRTDGLF